MKASIFHLCHGNAPAFYSDTSAAALACIPACVFAERLVQTLSRLSIFKGCNQIMTRYAMRQHNHGSAIAQRQGFLLAIQSRLQAQAVRVHECCMMVQDPHQQEVRYGFACLGMVQDAAWPFGYLHWCSSVPDGVSTPQHDFLCLLAQIQFNPSTLEAASSSCPADLTGGCQ